MYCPRCGMEATSHSAFCSGCGSRLIEAQTTKRRQLSRIAGIIDLTNAALSLVMVLAFAIYILPEAGYGDTLWSLLLGFALVVGLVSSALAAIGGMHALRKKSWGMAIAGAAAGTAGGIWFLGLAALILTAISKDEFKQPVASGQTAQGLVS